MNIIITIIAVIPLALSIITLISSITYVYTTIRLRKRDEYSKYVYIVKDMDRAAMFRHALKSSLGYEFIRAMETNNYLRAMERHNQRAVKRYKQRAVKRYKQRAVKRYKVLSGSEGQKSSLFSNEVNRGKA